MYLEGVYYSIAFNSKKKQKEKELTNVAETGYMLIKLSFTSWAQTQQIF